MKYLIDFRIYEQTWGDNFGRTSRDCVNDADLDCIDAFCRL